MRRTTLIAFNAAVVPLKVVSTLGSAGAAAPEEPHPAQGWGCAAPPNSVVDPCAANQTFTSTGAEQAYTVPANVTRLRVTAVGGHGGYGDGPAAAGGRGSLVSADIAVTPQQVLYVLVGGHGHWWREDGQADGRVGGFNGGGDVPYGAGTGGSGGGASDVRTVSSAGDPTTSLDSRLIVAAGGGGGGFGVESSATGGDGDGDAANRPLGGAAGTGATGGAAGVGNNTAGAAGSYGQGAPAAASSGGAGGGGRYGGGSGTIDAGGGGGSSLVPAGGTGPVASDQEAMVSLTLIAPEITAHATPATPWSDGPVAVTFTCTAGSAPIADCADPVIVDTEGSHTVEGTVTDLVGGTATTSIEVKVDRTAPAVRIRGVRDGQIYPNPHRARCTTSDAQSGIASCTIDETSVRNGRRRLITVVATATDRVGNHATATTTYAVRRARTYLKGAVAAGGVYRLQPGQHYRLVMFTAGVLPRAVDPQNGRALVFRRAGTTRGLTRWRATLVTSPQLGDDVRTLRITVGDFRRTLRFAKDATPVS